MLPYMVHVTLLYVLQMCVSLHTSVEEVRGLLSIVVRNSTSLEWSPGTMIGYTITFQDPVYIDTTSFLFMVQNGAEYIKMLRYRLVSLPERAAR